MVIIKNIMDGSYYAGPSPIGPRFGATKETAERFGSRMEAAEVARRFPLTVLFAVEDVEQ